MRARRAAVKLSIGAAALGVLAWGLTFVKDARDQLSCEGWNTGEFFEAATGDDVVRCLEDGANIEARDEYGQTPLHWAAEFSESPAVMKVLLDAGANIEAQAGRGWIDPPAQGGTGRHRAAQGGTGYFPAVVKVLT